MDAFEPIREAAQQLHSSAIAAGADESQPLTLVHAAIREMDLALFWLQPGDPALKGAHAVFDEQSGAICCADEGGDSERAALVAHEIGHAALHSKSAECSTADVDTSQSTEVVPVGLQRIEDYGGHERRELQANVFGREFLLPRATARNLFLTEHLSAASIATGRQLPKDLVRQQLLDSLLLPTAVPEPPTQSRPPRVDPSQDRAANHFTSAFLLQAGPGTGKTSTVVKKVIRLIEQGVDPSSIIILTFSNRAAGELSARIAAALPNHAGRIWIGTFHAFGLDLVRRYHEQLGLLPDPPLFDRSDAIEVLEEILPTLPLVHYRNLWDPTLVLRDIVSAISRAKDELVGPGRYATLAAAMKDKASDEATRIAAEKALEVAAVYELYQQELIRRKAVDFGDLIMRPALLLEQEEAIRTVVQLRHRHVLVDEYQDVNRASARLLHALAGDGRHLWVVGDSRQSIYRFRGASSANMAAFSTEYPHTTVDRLEINYRSSDEIVRNLVAIAPHLGASEGMLPLVLSADAGVSGIKPQIRSFDTLDLEAEGIAASVVDLVKAGVRFRDQAVLCRSNSRLNDIAAVLEARGIPVLHLGSFFEREEIRDLLSLLGLAIDPFGDGLARVGAMRRYDLSLQDISTATKRMRETESPAAGKFDEILAPGGFSEQGTQGLQKLAQDLEGIPSNISPWEFLTTYLLDRSDLIATLATDTTPAACMRGVAIWQLLNFARDPRPSAPGLPIRRMLDRVRQLVLLAEERDMRQVPAAALHIDAVRLMTIHGSKGLQFEAVHVPGLTVSSFPSSYRAQRCPPPDGMIDGPANTSSKEESQRAHEQEEQCLFFVAVSRAKRHLRLYRVCKQPNGKKRSPSPFLGWIPPALIDEIQNPEVLPLPADAPRPTAVRIAWPAGWNVTDTLLRTYEKCPRRFFYTHVLELGSAKKPTAFSRTHECIYGLIEWLAEARIDGDPDEAAAEEEFERLWQEKGPTDHAFATEYRQLADRLVKALVRLGAGRRFSRSEPLALDLAAGRVMVEPDEMAHLPNGTVVLRRVRTGFKRVNEYDSLEYSLYHLAARDRFNNAYQIEALHLTNESLDPVVVSEQKIQNRRSKAGEMVASIAAGSFPPIVDAVTCPRCPHFFICPATPKGPLTLS
jgi:superfamily I DNA/RNA helicase/Zn-dependent peptidase ImmA (M78 family)